jgi:hypothetical protein
MGLEQEKPLDVERPLVVEQPPPAAEDELRITTSTAVPGSDVSARRYSRSGSPRSRYGASRT